jgi:hypothetical protein
LIIERRVELVGPVRHEPQRGSSMRLPSRSSTTASTFLCGCDVEALEAAIRRRRRDAERLGKLGLDVVRPARREGVAAAHGGPGYERDRS